MMKIGNKLVACLLVFVMIFCSAVAFDTSALRVQAAQHLHAPVVTLFGSVIAWNPIDGADIYDIFANGHFFALTGETRYDLAALDLSASVNKIEVVPSNSARTTSADWSMAVTWNANSSNINSDHSPVQTFNGNSYQVINRGMNFYEARDYAESLGGHLVTITSQSEQDFVNQIVNTYGTQNSYWMGGTWADGGVSNPATDFHWLTGEPVTFTAWAPGQPDAGGASNQATAFVRRGHAGWGWEGLWDDLACYPNNDDPNYTFNIRHLGLIVEWSQGQSTPQSPIVQQPSDDYQDVVIAYSIDIVLNNAAIWIQNNQWWLQPIAEEIGGRLVDWLDSLSRENSFASFSLSGNRWVAGNDAYIYTLPFNSSRTPAKLQNREVIQVSERIETSQGAWAKFTTSGGQIRFVRTEHLRNVTEINDFRWVSAQVSIRKHPRINSAVVTNGTVPKGSRLWVSYESPSNSEFVRVRRVCGAEGYVERKYLRFDPISGVSERLTGSRYVTARVSAMWRPGSSSARFPLNQGEKVSAEYAVKIQNTRWVFVRRNDGTGGYVSDQYLRW